MVYSLRQAYLCCINTATESQPSEAQQFYGQYFKLIKWQIVLPANVNVVLVQLEVKEFCIAFVFLICIDIFELV